METREVIIVGGGPAGSSCAWRLKRAGVDVLVLDKVAFPRLKLCAGWITPQVLVDLNLEVDKYPFGFLTFKRIQAHFKGLRYRMACEQHSIRRYEFDDYLLRRSSVDVEVQEVKKIAVDGPGYRIDDNYRCRYLVGAGGTRCPVYRSLFREANPRAKELQTVTYEHEFPYNWEDGDCHLWFFNKGLPGYAWYVPKANGYLNVGIGGMAARLKQRGEDIKYHWAHFAKRLARKSLVEYAYKPAGYSYYVKGPIEIGRIGNAFITGDAAGLATPDLCEGIGPAVRSGLLAAEAITESVPYSLESVTGRSIPIGSVSRFLEYAFTRGNPHRITKSMRPTPSLKP